MSTSTRKPRRGSSNHHKRRSVSRSSSSPSPSPPHSPRSPTSRLFPSGLGAAIEEDQTGSGGSLGREGGALVAAALKRERKRTLSRPSSATGIAGMSSRRMSTGTGAPPRSSRQNEYPADESSQVGLSGFDDRGDRDGYVFVNGDDTEVELRRRPPPDAQHSGEGPDHPHTHVHGHSHTPPPPGARTAQKRLPPDVTSHPLPARLTLLPWRCNLGPLSFILTRKRCEDFLLLGAVVVGIFQLGYGWNEWALVGELSTLLILSIAYIALRVRQVVPTPSSPTAVPQGRRGSPSFWPPLNSRDRRRGSNRTGSPRPTIISLAHDEDAVTGVGGRGCIWGTEEREYRDCIDDGALFALLLCPLTAAALLNGALKRLVAEPDTATLPGWYIEPPLVIPTTPIRRVSENIPHGVTDAIRALSALAISRRNLVQLFTLLSFVLLVQLTWSVRHEVKLVRAASPPPVHTPLPGTSGGSVSEHEGEHRTLPGTFWLRRGEGRRNLSVIGFAFFVTACCVVVKIATAYIDYGVWSDMSHSDIIIATLFYQFCLYVCVRLARRGFTLGELGIVSHAATALFMETVNMTRMKIPLITTPYIKTYRLPTPLLIFQLALIPGSLLTGILLSPLLYLSRHLAQRPVHKLRFPHEKPVHRRLLALAFYAGALLVVVGVVGTWARWCLGWRDPWFWVLRFLLEGRHAWTRPALISYWGGLALFSVAAWQRQLSRARRHRRYRVPGRGEREGSTSTSSSVSTVPPPTASGPAHDGISAVATQMMDAADQRMPTLSVNARRKSFHALAVAMFIPGMTFDPAFTHLSFSVAFAAFTFAEYVRYFALWPLGASVHLFLNEFIDHKDSGTAILSHFYLLSGCATPLWFEGPSEIMAFFGVLSLGIGDAIASIVGRRVGYVRWSPASGKTVEGSAGFTVSVVAAASAMWLFGAVDSFSLVAFTVTTVLVTLMEAVSAQNDNLVLPVYGWAVGVLLGV